MRSHAFEPPARWCGVSGTEGLSNAHGGFVALPARRQLVGEETAMTPAWMSGYTSDVAYTLGFYKELAPSFLNYVCVINGVEGIPVGDPLRYCELGCGRGYGTTLLAAANPDIEFVGIDFNPLHINEARAFAN